MKRKPPQTPYTTTAVVFVIIGFVGLFFFGWGEVRLGFLLLIYCLLLLGFRMDEVSRQLASIDRRLAELTAPPAALKPTDPPRPAKGSPCSPEDL